MKDKLKVFEAPELGPIICKDCGQSLFPSGVCLECNFKILEIERKFTYYSLDDIKN